MNWFHRHTWTEQERFIIPRPSSVKASHVYDTDTLTRLISGQTIIVLRCSVCGDIKYVEVPGVQTMNDWNTRNIRGDITALAFLILVMWCATMAALVKVSLMLRQLGAH